VIAKVNSATFKYPEGLGQIKSSVEVEPSEAVALHNYHVALSPRMLTCLRSMLPAVLGGKTERDGVHYGPVSVTRMPPLGVPQSFGIEIRTSVITPRLPYAVPVYVDEIGFIAGTAEVSLEAFGAPQPIEANTEARLVSLLHSRAHAHVPSRSASHAA
jgi:hypothetical protein